MQAFERYFLAANRWALILLLAAMSVIIFTNVVMRYTTSNSLEWAEEVSRHMMIWLTFLGAGPVLRYGGHIAVENLQDALPRAGAIAVRAFVAALLFAFFGFMVWYGWLYMQRTMFQLTAVTQIPFAYIYSAMLFGGILLIVHWLLVVRGYVLRREFASDAHFDANASASL
ncbi:TRAP-type C4-dicarboxylate transport system permease small subunit [Variovorax boronicumulans]|uniref:TRAP transporter small permease protein n=1 Tax=Variovorax boronicumulans TaxID=436515 RepID=A0AAW8D161_9BURK|nr:TRAP transporter small permease [Variovorax boronicumulans]MBJ2155118.1 TRAP transporter small permease [Variovorax sp. IB41]MDP9894458.1 TRAP-type C4-dicarboxylate transport system permease small subunit [Variovorax boronicumulans]MDP9992822.1 TRAP-type C4-dicarboxylate transport system permease small subunit [Variovorax boronicumulans]MDQ0004087.1 TRAP-type C4-dicarboxylate transport system permease small subunit [Variovorax boronicumulans]MDQ0054277.1 TRAP-type C4-dicarboxylate transport